MQSKPIDDDIIRTGIGPQYAECKGCELLPSCNGPSGRFVEGERPRDWQEGGLMIIGEGPGKVELTKGRPFVGPSGRLLDRLLAAAGVKREKLWITNATLGFPHEHLSQKGTRFSQRFPMAVHSCLPRLETEIATARPRIILTLGRSAFAAVAGSEVVKQKLVPNPCEETRCDPSTRKVGPVIACAKGDCNWYALAPTEVQLEGEAEIARARLAAEAKGEAFSGSFKPEAWLTWAKAIKEQFALGCPSCGAKISGLRPKAMKCPSCGGKKKRVEEYVSFTDPYALIGRNGVAGAIFEAGRLPSKLDEYGVAYVVPTYHPSFCLREVSKKRDSGTGDKKIGGQFAARAAVEHMMKAKRLLDSEPRWVDPTPLVVDDPATVAAWLAEPGRYACDIETNSFEGPDAVTKITCIGFARTDRTEVLVVPTLEPEPALLRVFEAFFDRDDVETIFHNGMYDRYVMHRIWRIWVYNQASDTKASHNVLYPDEEHNLGFVAHELTDAPHWKEPHKKPPKGEKSDTSGYRTAEELHLYNARDTLGTARIDEVIRGPIGGKGRLHEEDQGKAHDADVRNYDIAVAMQANGMPLSAEVHRDIETSFVREKNRLQQKMADIVGLPADRFWPAPKDSYDGYDLNFVLFDPTGPLRLPILDRNKNGSPKSDKNVLKRLVGEAPEFIQALLRWRMFDYNLSHYVRGKGLVPDLHGRIHPVWKPGLVTGRWSSEPNCQNWPYRGVDPALNMRRMIVAPPGRKLIGADYAALELRIMASLSGDETLIRIIKNAREDRKLEEQYDPHSFLSNEVFGDVWQGAAKAERKRLRDTTKRVWYGSLYGAGAQTIIDSILDSDYEGPPLTVPFVEGVLRMIVDTFPGVGDWRREAWAAMQRDMAVYSPITRRHRIFPLGDVDITVAYNYPIQSGAGDLMNWRMAGLDDRLADVDPTAFIIAQVHDAVYLECDEDRAEQVRDLVTETLTVDYAMKPGSEPMRFDAQAEIADTWDCC